MSGHSKFANIKHKKEKNDAAKGKIFTILGREIAVAVKEGGPDPANNFKLSQVIAKAKANNMPNDTIDRGIKKAAGDANSVDYETLTYEGYGPNGVAIIVDTLTDNKNRTAANVRSAFTKGGGNYAASIKAGELAEEKGFAQVLWLDGVEKKYVEEVGSMNIMFKISGKIYTAACDGTVLPGVTRRSCIELLRDWGYDVVEGPLAIADVMKAGHDGTLEEVFGTGTAAVVSPVKELDWKGDKVFISEGKIGPLTQKLYDTMTGMQWGKIPDTKGWIVPVCKG